ncbi:MAG TPA: lysine 2,3-aminomutase [Candidatus Deferrimicrobium sp.]|nr:lysine 2,3-aminomutase [Candidatus Deferrimicrobium sp.]
MKLFNKKQEQIARALDPGVNESQWFDWEWQLKHSLRDIAAFEKITGIHFEKEEKAAIENTIEKFPLCITPYYVSLLDTANYRDDPLFKQAFPSPQELVIDPAEMSDPLHEDLDSPVPGLTHRYPDRVLFLVSNACALYCRHCTRKRKVGAQSFVSSKTLALKGIEYIEKTPQVRDVLLSGGDPLLLSDEYLDWLLARLRRIPHVEIIRIGTRIPVALPFRITGHLLDIMKKYHPLWINTHINHPREITPETIESLRKLADAGFPLGNQTVLLAGINDCPLVIKKLIHELVRCRVRPYYLYQCDLSEGLTHFRTTVSKGIEVLEHLIGHTSGLAVPTFVVDNPGGGGKIPIIPNYLVSWSPEKVVLRNYLGGFSTYKEPVSYRSPQCSDNCNQCSQEGGPDGNSAGQSPQSPPPGIARLLSGSDDAYVIRPGQTVSLE